MIISLVFAALPPTAAAGYLYVTGLERVSWVTFAAPLGLSLLLGGVIEGGRLAGMMDTEVWNGRITAKTHDSMSCCHCRQECDTCTRTDDKGRTETYQCRCHEVCDHPRDYRWDLRVSTGDTINVDKCEPRESNVPAAWTQAYVGEPASVEHLYKNYLLADPESVYQQAGNVSVSLPATTYPSVHGLYRVDHVVGSWPAAVKPALEAAMDETNADIGGAQAGQPHALRLHRTGVGDGCGSGADQGVDVRQEERPDRGRATRRYRGD